MVIQKLTITIIIKNVSAKYATAVLIPLQQVNTDVLRKVLNSRDKQRTIVTINLII